METYLEIQNWVMGNVNDTSSTMAGRVQRNIHTILTPEYLGVEYDWNLNATVLSLSSGASTFALPSLCAVIRDLWNETYDVPVVKMTRRQREMHNRDDAGIVDAYYRMGNNILINQADGAQSIRMEWYPLFASLVNGASVPLCPDKQVIAEGALWLTLEQLGKPATTAKQMFLAGKERLFGDSNTEFISFEDPTSLEQEG